MTKLEDFEVSTLPYMVVTAPSARALELTVSEGIRLGWKPQGGISMVYQRVVTNDGDGFFDEQYAQAMVQFKEKA